MNGIWMHEEAEGFADFLKIMSKPKHGEYKKMKEWAAEQGWEPFELRRAALRVWLAGNLRSWCLGERGLKRSSAKI